MKINLLLATALSLYFVSPAMAQNAPSDIASACASCVSSVNLAQLGPVRGRPAQAGEAVAIPRGDLLVEGEGNVCCPPITSGKWAQYFVPQQSPGKNLTLTYGYDFVASPALDAQMNAYAPFAALWTPVSHVANSVALVAEVRAWSSSTPPTNWNQSGYTDVYPGKKQLRAWWTNGSGVWTGGGFEQTLRDNNAIAPNHFDPNKSYMIRLSLVLNYKKTPNDNSWFQLPLSCMEKFVTRGSFVSGRVAPNAGLDAFRLKD
ncbi:hypothetical protein LPB140_03340 [Sphingorhabdus lutea]|uniref:Uncharacterized protein n=1 Tax=Sphingorhabdus lutea TaxID=1913578 RepID=A0A1L3JA62_9SPHN|nr:hypothetical protein [Sphingorhabdus lutea]APG62008.1 hypothetical protein LPB140_03340 [Sphingorhabdus lutea]